MVRHRVALSLGVGSIGAAVLFLLSDALDVATVQPLVRPFGLLGFAFGNIHQGSYLISGAALALTLAALSFLFLTVVAAVSVPK